MTRPVKGGVAFLGARAPKNLGTMPEICRVRAMRARIDAGILLHFSFGFQ